MSEVIVRQAGGANIVSIPKAIARALGIEVGTKLNLSIDNNKIVMEPIVEELTLEEVLAGSPKGCFAVIEEDAAWLNAKPVGKEI